jgi:ubiquinone/menaquinone biosynthesis C-methylase UbiE
MPRFYNAYIQATQRRALAPFLRVDESDRALDVGCGVGRWSLIMAANGADVTGIDVSPSMVAEANRRAEERGLSSRCRFVEGDVAELELDGTFSLIVVVTVLQHILEETRLRAVIARLARHLRPGGRLVALEAAPARREPRCDSRVFQSRCARCAASTRRPGRRVSCPAMRGGRADCACRRSLRSRRSPLPSI